MITTLYRGKGPLAWLVCWMLVLGLIQSAQASHLLGGEMTYRYLDATGPAAAPLRYELTVAVYNNCSSAVLNDFATVGIYDQATGNKLVLTTTNFPTLNNGSLDIPQTSLDACVTPTIPVGCTILGNSQAYRLQKFVGIVNLPTTTQGFYAFWTAYARNLDITNLFDPGNQYMSLYCTLAPPALANHSPVFVNKAVANLCANDTTYILNNAVDADGDQLVYSLGQPYGSDIPASFSGLPTLLGYNAGAGYAPTTPLGTVGGNYSSINAATGMAKFRTTAALNNKFVVAVDVREYRTINGQQVLIGITRRDVQLVVVTCPVTPPPVLPTNAPVNPVPRTYTVEAGSTLTLPLPATQANGHPLTMTLSSVLLDGAGGYDATFAGNAGTLVAGSPAGEATTTSPASPVAGTFVYKPACTDVRATPYDVTLLVQDNGCAGQLVGDVLRITVVKPAGPTGITGNATVCGPNTAQSYTATGGTAPNVSWTATGGTILGSNTANPVQVQWPAAGTYTLVAQGATQYGCPTGQVTKTVVVSPPPALTITGSQTICQGSSTTLTVAGGTAPYTLAGGAAPVSGAGHFVLSPTQTTTYTVTDAGSACVATGQVSITVNAKPVAAAGSAVTMCAGHSAQLGAAAVAGSTYSWSPATGLSNASIANPTVTLPNATASPLTQTYTLTETNAAGCTSTSTVAVTVNPLPVVAPGAAVAICSGGVGQLGAAPVPGLAYQWSPATGLSSSTIANPAVTLTTAGAASTQIYTLTVTSAAGCTSTGTVTVTVNPLPVANAGAAVAMCAGSSAQLGAAAVAGLTYSWSPTTGLSNAHVANPTVTLPNAMSSPLTQTYTLTVANASNCTSTSTVAATVHPLPGVAPGAAVAICSGSTGQLGSAPVAGYTYSWSPAIGLSNASLANPTITLATASGAASTQVYTLTVTNTATNCSSSGTVAVTVNPLPAAAAGAPVAICSGGTGQLGSAPVAGSAYSWSPTTGLSNPASANPTVTLTNPTSAATTQTYTVTVTSAAGCVNTGTVAVTVNPLPTANAGAAVSFCSGGTGQLGSAPVVGYTYSWSPTAGLSNPAAANPTVTLTNATTAATTQAYALTVTNSATGCTSTATVTVTVQPLPVATAGATVAICAGGTGQLGAMPMAGNTYSWSPAIGLSNPASANPTVTLPNTTTGPLTQTYTLTVTSATGCTSTSTVAVTVHPLPGAAPGAAVAICSGGTGQLGSAPVVGYTYSWSPATGLSNPASANPTVTQTNLTGTTTTQIYTLTVTSAAGCLSTGTVAVAVSPAVVPGTIGTSQTICAGSVPAPLTSAAPASGGTGTYMYQWEMSIDNTAWQAITNATGLSYAPGALTATTYFRRRAAGVCGVAHTSAVTIQVQPLLVPTVALPTPPAQCAGTAFTFTPVPANAGAAPTYQWLVNGVSVGTGSAYTSSTLADGDQVQVVLTPTAGFCASGTATATARVSLTPTPAPTLTILAQTTMPVCAGTPLRFSLGQATAIGTNPQYQWQVDGVNVAGATSSVFTSTSLRNGQAVTLVLRTPNACGQPATATSAGVRVVLSPSVRLSAGPNKTIMEGESVELEGTADGSYPVVWTPAATLAIGSNPLRPKASPTVTTTYTLSAGAGYCADPSTVTVTVSRRIRIPNAFTPNADNNDDTWQIEGIEDYPNNHVLIVNRWGGKIFEASGYSRATEWKGTINGEPAPIGTYYYVLTLGNGKSYTGPLTIVN